MNTVSDRVIFSFSLSHTHLSLYSLALSPTPTRTRTQTHTHTPWTQSSCPLCQTTTQKATLIFDGEREEKIPN